MELVLDNVILDVQRYENAILAENHRLQAEVKDLQMKANHCDKLQELLEKERDRSKSLRNKCTMFKALSASTDKSNSAIAAARIREKKANRELKEIVNTLDEIEQLCQNVECIKDIESIILVLQAAQYRHGETPSRK